MDFKRLTMRHLSFMLFSSVVIVIMTVIAAMLFLKLRLHPLFVYGIAINGALFTLYAIDKLFSKIGLIRVPESLLHLLTLLGATPAALFAQYILRHKTIKASFRKRFYTILVLQFFIVAIGVGFIIYWA